MAHKTITISEDAYNAFRSLKKEHESFSDVILRLFGGNAKKLLEAIESSKPNEDLSASIEWASKKMRKTELRKAEL